MAAPLTALGECFYGAFGSVAPCQKLYHRQNLLWRVEGDPHTSTGATLSATAEDAAPMTVAHQVLNEEVLSDLAWNVGASSLAAGSWSGNVLIYAVPLENAQKRKVAPLMAAVDTGAAVLAVAAMDDPGYMCAANGDGDVVVVATEADEAALVKLASHDRAASCVAVPGPNCVVSGSWDGTVVVSDSRLAASDGRARAAMHTIDVGTRVYCLDAADDQIVVGGAATASVQCPVYLYDLRRLGEDPAEAGGEGIGADASLLGFGDLTRTSAAGKIETACRVRNIALSTLGDNVATAVSSTGRGFVVHLEEIMGDDPTVQLETSFSWKAHRYQHNGTYHLYAINSVNYHKSGMFVTAGDDGTVTVWDHVTKQRMEAFFSPGLEHQGYDCPSALAAFSSTVSRPQLAVALTGSIGRGQRYVDGGGVDVGATHSHIAVYEVNDATLRRRR